MQPAQSGRGFTRLAIAIVVAAVLVSATLYAMVGQTPKTLTSIATSVSYSTETETVSTTLTVSSVTTTTLLMTTASIETTTVTLVSTTTVMPTTASSVSSISGNTSTQSAASCTITGQPGPLWLRVVSDSNQTPVGGAQVTATSNPVYCGNQPATTKSSATFTTNAGTEWYSLDTGNDGGYSFVIVYGGQTYNFTASLRPVSMTCATLSVPSGRTNVTITEFQMSCPSTNATLTTAANSASSLALRLSVNMTTISSMPAVSAYVSELNLLGSVNNVTASNNWLIPLNWKDGAPCWVQGWPVGFAIASGRYTLSNLTTAQWLDLMNPNSVTYSCPDYGPFSNAVGYSFQPMSDVAAGYGCGVNFCSSWPVATGLTQSLWGPTTGYWDQNGVFTAFPHGTYTVMGEDEWGHMVLSYFTI